jgi:hypothetical protein
MRGFLQLGCGQFRPFLFCRTKSNSVAAREAKIGSGNLPYVVKWRKLSTSLGRTKLCPSICKLVVANRARNIKSKVKIRIYGIHVVHQSLKFKKTPTNAL